MLQARRTRRVKFARFDSQTRPRRTLHVKDISGGTRRPRPVIGREQRIERPVDT
jgi:hypothetical protein